jgi:hypothetical protein
MVPVIYTTYGMAMGNHPEVLAASGGLKPGGAELLRERATWVRVARVGCWLSAGFALVRLRQRKANSRMKAAEA